MTAIRKLMIDIQITFPIEEAFKQEFRTSMTVLTEKLAEIITAQQTAAQTEQDTKNQLLAAITIETNQVAELLNELKETISAQTVQIQELLAQLGGDISPEIQALLDAISENTQSSVVQLNDAITAVDAISGVE